MFCKKTIKVSAFAFISGITSHSLFASSLPLAAESSQLAKALTKKDDIFSSVQFKPEASMSVAPSVPLINQSKSTFKFKGIKLFGNTVISQDNLEYLWNNKKNATISMEEIQSIVQQIVNVYRQKGYILAQAVLPPQDILPHEGIVNINILEGILNKIEIQGGTDKNKRLIERQLKGLIQNKPFNMNDLESRLINIKKTPSLTITTFLKPNDKPGYTKLIITIEKEKKIDLAVSYANLGSKYSSRNRLSTDAVLYDLVDRSKLLLSHLQSSDPNIFSLYRIRQTQFLGNDGTRGYLEYVKSRTNGKYPFPTKSTYDNWNVMVMHPFIYRQNETLKGRLAIDGQDDVIKAFGHFYREDYIRSIRVGGLYNQSYLYDFWEVSGLLNKGLASKLGAKASKNPSRYGGRHNYHYAEGRFVWSHRFNTKYSLLGSMGWQYSPTPLLSSEEFSVGATNYGRGYDSVEIAGDSGYAGLVESRYAISEPLQLYVSYGSGKVFNNKEKRDVKKTNSLASASIGIRSQTSKHLEFFAEISKPLTKYVSSRDNKKNVIRMGATLKF